MNKNRTAFIFFAVFAFTKLNAQIPNSDFELWDTISGFEYPVNWVIDNEGTVTAGAYKDTDSYSGLFTLQLGRASTTFVKATVGFPLDYHPSVLKGFVKPDMANPDTFRIKILLYYLNQVVDSGTLVNVDYMNVNYVAFSIDITQNSSYCDSAKIELTYFKNNPATFYYYVNVDHLFFDDNSGIFSIPSSRTLQITPNPSASLVNITNLPSKINQFELTIINQPGQRFDLGLLSRTDLTALDISFLPDGIYEMVLHDKQKIWTGTFMKQ